MDSKQLKRGNELEKEIEVIKRAMKDMKANKKIENYWLHISSHKDGSGVIADLVGANVAMELADAIYAELQNQLAKREEEFAAL